MESGIEVPRYEHLYTFVHYNMTCADRLVVEIGRVVADQIIYELDELVESVSK